MTVAVIALPLGTTPFSISDQTAKIHASDTSLSQLVLDSNSANLVAIDKSISEIKPGDSKVQVEDRQKAEAAAKAKADALAAARAKAEQQASVQRAVISRESRTLASSAPVEQNVDLESLYARAGSAYGVAPQILKAIHLVETGGDTYTTARSNSGATGPMQFLPSTFRAHAVDGNNDGHADIMNVEDAVYTAAEYLKACGYDGTPEGIRKAILGYNHSTSYYNRVISIAHSLGF